MPRRARIILPNIPQPLIQLGHNRQSCFFAYDEYRVNAQDEASLRIQPHALSTPWTATPRHIKPPIVMFHNESDSSSDRIGLRVKAAIIGSTGVLLVTAITFDTLKFANRLKAAGVPSAQAEAEAEALSEVFETNTDALATREDVNLLEERIDSKFDLLRKDIQSMDERFSAQFLAMEERFSAKFLAMEERFSAQFLAMEERFSAQFLAVEERFSAQFLAVEERFSAQLLTMEERLTGRFDNLWLKLVVTLGGVVVVALGLFSSTLPKLFGH